MHIRVINPTITTSWEQESLDAYRNAAGPGTEVSIVTLDWGTPSVEGHVAESLVTPDIIAKAIEAEREGADAVIVDCMGDPGVQACREAIDIPVIGPAEASMHLAAVLGHRFLGPDRRRLAHPGRREPGAPLRRCREARLGPLVQRARPRSRRQR